MKKKGLIFVISGPSGSGKTTLVSRLAKAKAFKNQLVKSVSFTTRPKRSGEKEKKDYFFISEAEFRRKRRAKKFLELTKYLGYYYATPRDFVEKHLQQGKCVVLSLDLKGARAIRRFYPRNTVTIFIMPPSLKALWARIQKRCQETPEDEIRRRIQIAKKELLSVDKYSYCLVNNKLRRITAALKKIILEEICAHK